MDGGAKLVSIIVVTILIIGGGGWYFYLQQNKEPNYDFIVASKGDLIQEVSVTGHVNPIDMADLAFSTGGIIEEVKVDVGDIVEKGAILMRLDDDELQADLAQGLAALSSAQAQLTQFEALVTKEKATLADLEQGTRQEEVNIQEVKVANAIIALSVAENDLINSLEDAYTKADDAIRAKLDLIFSNQGGGVPNVAFTTTDSDLESTVEINRGDATSMFVVWRESLDTLTENDHLPTYAATAKVNLIFVRTLLDNASELVNGALPTSSFTQTTLDSYAASISTGRTNVNTAFTSVLTEESGFTTAQANLSVAENELSLLQAGTTIDKLNAQKAVVAQAEANLSIQAGAINEARARVSKTRTLIEKKILRASIDGIVSDIGPEVGESVTANSTLITIISSESFHIETAITETDIVLVDLLQEAAVTLDAYGDGIAFDATVTKIDPAERVIEGLPTYNVTLSFNTPDERIRSGMTANIDIITATRENVVAIPQRAVISLNGSRSARILQGEEIVTVSVRLGIRGSDGTVEILEGISEGDQVITFLEEE